MTFEDFHESMTDVERYSSFYDSKAEFAFHRCPEARDFFERAQMVADLGCGTGASTLFIARICPSAKIVTVDNSTQPLDAVTQKLGKRFQNHFPVSVHEFLKKSHQKFDVMFLVKSSHALRSGDCQKLAEHTKKDGYLMQVDGDVKLPEQIGEYFQQLWIDEQPITINSLWRKSS